jgi:non-ribosomal peptide synthetase component F
MHTVAIDEHTGGASTLRPREQDQALQIPPDWNESAADYPDEKPVHRLFEPPVDKKPNGIAPIHGERRLTYAELNRSANQTARHLRGLGVRANGHSRRVLNPTNSSQSSPRCHKLRRV